MMLKTEKNCWIAMSYASFYMAVNAGIFSHRWRDLKQKRHDWFYKWAEHMQKGNFKENENYKETYNQKERVKFMGQKGKRAEGI